ncbi:MAG: hypothetical protein ACI9JN_001992 [Bacteroidia bacterium]|jgi:hypothetical protein
MIKTLQILLLTIIIASCTETQEQFTHTYASTEGINNAQLTYAPHGVDLDDSSNAVLFRLPLMKDEIIIPSVKDDLYSIVITDDNGITSFEQIPAKFINIDATIEVTRNIFQSYFPEEWTPMKGSQFSTLYIQKADDAEVFYIKTVYTGTNNEIGMHSEDH